MWSKRLGLLVLLVFLWIGPSKASFLRAKGLWPLSELRKVAVYRDEKGETLAFVAGSSGLYTIDVSDPYHPKKLAFNDDIPFPDQIQALSLTSDGKKTKLLVADGSGGLCIFEASNKGLKKPNCLEGIKGVVYKAEERNGLLFIANGQGLELWELRKNEEKFLSQVSTPGQARDFYLYLPDPSLLEEPFDNTKDQTGLRKTSERIGTIYVADEWAGLQIIALIKEEFYDTSKQKVSYRLAPWTSWKEGPVYAVAGEGPFLAASLGREVRIFQLENRFRVIYTFSKAVDPYFDEAKDLFMKAFLPEQENSNKKYFVFIAAARYGVKVLEINQAGNPSVNKVAESLIGPMVESLYVDDKFFFYAADSQAGLSIGQLVDFVSPSLKFSCENFPTVVLTLSNLGPFKGKPAFFCLWLELPTCGATRGLSTCKAQGFSEEKINWLEMSYVLSDPRAQFFEWLPGRHCYPVKKLEEIKYLPILRAEHGFTCEELDGARLNFCLDLDVDWYPDLCLSETLNETE